MWEQCTGGIFPFFEIAGMVSLCLVWYERCLQSRFTRLVHSRRMISTMTATVYNIHIMEDALSNWSRSKTSTVTNAYSTIMEFQRREIGIDPPPDNHLMWIHDLTRGVGVHILHRSGLEKCITMISDGVNPVDDTMTTVAIESFDPDQHMVVTTQLTPLSYIVDNVLPGTVPLLGPGAMGVSSHFKYCVVWWNV